MQRNFGLALRYRESWLFRDLGMWCGSCQSDKREYGDWLCNVCRCDHELWIQDLMATDRERMMVEPTDFEVVETDDIPIRQAGLRTKWKPAIDALMSVPVGKSIKFSCATKRESHETASALRSVSDNMRGKKDAPVLFKVNARGFDVYLTRIDD